MQDKIIELVLTLASLFFIGLGVFLILTGDWTNGLLSMILGELIDMPKRGKR